MKTRKEIEINTLEDLRERLIHEATENKVFLSALNRARFISGNEEKLELVQQIRNREANELQFETDIKLVEEKLNEFSGTKNKPNEKETKI